MSVKNILVIGLGGVGLHLTQRLVHDGYGVTVIESSPQLISSVNDKIDAKIIEGNAMELACWQRAKAETMDLLIAVTNEDSVNMIASIIADRLGIPRKVARVRSPEYGYENSFLNKNDFKIDLVIHPEELVAQEMARLVMRASANDVVDIGEGQMKVVAMRVNPDSPIVNKTLKEIDLLHNDFRFKIVAVARGIATIIPGEDDTILPNDQVFIMLHEKNLPQLMNLMDMREQSIHKVMIVGGGMVGARVAELLGKTVKITLIENDKEHAEELASTLKNTDVLLGDGTDVNVMVLGGLMEMDSFIATTGNNETNIISCLLAKHIMNRSNVDANAKVGKTIALVKKEDYLVLASTIGLDVALNKKISAADEIMKFIRMGELFSLAHLHGVDAEVIELAAAPKSQITKKPLKKMRSMLQEKQILIAGVVRNGGCELTDEHTVIEPNDLAVVVSATKSLKDARELFK
ncbi:MULTISPECIES: Trk system potassium transporter TrkA [Prosthecochloris]|uniref:Trk system potassium uptake protein TrkA n=1 Tax=Prosthecochloris marina TaxID=2017681 RepID=A0A317T396_9CHLB|nr:MULTISPECIES: Trk system potassium transporter TrkA [Prosthecochloris]PWW81104.1 Trk system potassium transporter TrkA [Prosthecochloris marina]UZJ37695.1 Trk system potassium transporter TrkA [Prosthecochloris sp. SCSIO W1103]UZJ39514.1 Trk system potassium transporter TrkA [Prosthecochloris sp. SCSIO W1102]